MVSHTTSGEWQSFEGRMRRRRAERLILRAEAAAEAGCLDDARQCLSEARTLDSRLPTLAALEEKLSAAPVLEKRRATRGRFAAAALITVAAIAAIAAAMALPRSHPASEPVIAAASVADSTTVPAAAAPDPLPSPVERFTSETAPVPASTPAPPPAQAQTPDVPLPEATVTKASSEERSVEPPPAEPFPVPRVPVAPVAPGISDAIRQEVSAVATRTMSFPELPVTGGVGGLKAPAAADPAPAAAAPAPPPSQEPAVRAVLDRYASAYSALDVDAAQRVWPGVNRGALARAFDSLESQQVSFGDCRIDVAASSASAVCSGTTSWSPKVGSGGSRTETRNWTFELARGDAGWEIVSARVQNR